MKEIRYLALGDSYTIGEGLNPEETWPFLIAEGLQARGINCAPPRVIAKTGWTTTELIQGIADAGEGGKYNMVSLLIGVNNQYRGQDIEIYKADLDQLLDFAESRLADKSGILFMLSIPDYGNTPFAAGRDKEKISRELETYNRIAEEKCAERGLIFVNITPFTASPEAYNMVVEDKLHPNGTMYKIWANHASGLLESGF